MKVEKQGIVMEKKYLFFKFQSRDRLESLQQGHIYMKNLRYFIEQEKESGIKGQGDIHEARMFSLQDINIYDKDTKEIVAIIPTCDNVRIKGDELTPVFCITYKDLSKHIENIDVEQGICTVRIEFDDRMLGDFSKDDNAYMLIIYKPGEFIRRVESKLLEMGHHIYHNPVDYRDTSIAYIEDGQWEANNAFCKEEYFRYQTEYRIVVDTQVEGHLEFDIGDISDISLLLKAGNELIMTLNIEPNSLAEK